MHCDGVEWLLIDAYAKQRIVMALNGDYGLEGLQRLDRSFETKEAWTEAMLAGCLSHDV